MPFRPHLFLRPTRPQCLNSNHSQAPRPRPRTPQTTSHFHTSVPLRDSASNTPSHYETLAIPQTATAAEIKRQYFALSKRYHPDRNPSDPTASTRFVAISEAYHVLGVPDKRAQYDSQLAQSHGARHSRWGRGEAPQHGSYSSHQSFAGSRPATGLNKKRGTFRGPPPSFYKSGGYGRHGAKRAEYAHHSPHPGTGAESGSETAGQESYGDFGSGFGPGQTGHGHEVPHFDDQRHRRTHDNVNEYIQARRRTRIRTDVSDHDRRSTLINFLLMSGVLGIIGITAKLMGDGHAERRTKRHGAS